MFRAILCLCFACGLPLRADTKPVAAGPLTVVVDLQNNRLSPESFEAMKAEAQQILNGAGMKLDWRLKQELTDHEQFGNVVVFTFKGTCSMDALPMFMDERGPLGLTYTSDGIVLPFGEVRCDRIRT